MTKKHDLVIRDNKGRYLYYEEKTNSEKSQDIYQFSNIHTQDHWKSFQLKTICGNKEWKSTESSIKSEEK